MQRRWMSSVSLSVSFSTKDVGQKHTIGVPKCWDGPASLDISDSNIVHLVGSGCALRHCRREPSQGEVRRRRRGGKGVRRPSSCGSAWYGFNLGSMLQCIGGHEPVLSAIVRQLHGKAGQETQCSIG